jgi:hypothetical protein
MMKIRILSMALLSIFCVIMAAAQTNMQDVLYLKNGSIIRGMIIQFIPDSTIKIQTIDGSIFVFPSLDITKIQKEENPLAARKKSDSVAVKEENSVLASVFAGVAIPGSDFSDAAEPGFTMGFQVHSNNEIGFLINFSYASNPSPVNESWTSYIVVAGLKVSLKKTEKMDLYIAPVVGVYMQKLAGSSVTAVTYGGMFGLQFNNHIGIGVRIVAANPEYKSYGTYYNGYSYSYYEVKAKLATSLTQIYLSVSF